MARELLQFASDNASIVIEARNTIPSIIEKQQAGRIQLNYPGLGLRG